MSITLGENSEEGSWGSGAAASKSGPEPSRAKRDCSPAFTSLSLSAAAAVNEGLLPA